MKDDTFWTVKAMRAYGGSFIKGLASAYEVADLSNAAKIEAAWPTELKRYAELGVALKAADSPEGKTAFLKAIGDKREAEKAEAAKVETAGRKF